MQAQLSAITLVTTLEGTITKPPYISHVFSREDRYALCASTAIPAAILLWHNYIDPWTLLEEVRNKYNYLKSSWELTYFGNGSNGGVGSRKRAGIFFNDILNSLRSQMLLWKVGSRSYLETN
jgi:hypothetical protein